MSPERFAIQLTPLTTAARVVRQRGRLRFQLLIAAIFGLLLAVAWLGPMILPGGPSGFVATILPPAYLPWLATLWGVSSAISIVLTAFQLAGAKRDLASIGQGVALYIDSQGIEFVAPTPVRATWQEITALKVAGTGFGAGPKLVLEVNGSIVAGIPLSYLDAMPAAIDSAVGARSMGRCRLDVSAMDKMI